MNNEKNALEKAKEKVSTFAQKFQHEDKNINENIATVSQPIGNQNEVKPLVECRVLFISVLDKIILILLALSFVLATYANFIGYVKSPFYGFWTRCGREILIILGYAVLYFFNNWLYKCAVKTMLCVTDKEVYLVKYFPFVKKETTIPLNKITAVSSHKVLGIFRGVVIHQYMSVPKVFFTWNAQEFKDKVVELTTTEVGTIQNAAENKNIINKNQIKYVGYAGLGLLGIVLIIGIVNLFGTFFNPAKNIPGTYTNNTKNIILYKSGDCDFMGFNDYCKWKYQEDLQEVVIDYTYSGYYYDYDKTVYLKYDNDKKTLLFEGTTFNKTN